ncbi:MAG: site-2 protease family protein [Anaerolineae bacterium]
MLSLTPSVLIERAIVLLVGMTIHEFAHAYIAYRMGDPTAKEQGRMTLNPTANIYWPGFLIGVLIGSGILGSAPGNPSRMRNPRWGYFWAVLAGPVSNLLLAMVFAIPFWLGVLEPAFFPASDFIPSVNSLFRQMIWLNIILFIFNLLPFWPLDGWTIVLAALPARQAVWWESQRQTTLIVGVALLALSWINIGIDPLGWIILEPSVFLLQLLTTPLF